VTLFHTTWTYLDKSWTIKLNARYLIERNLIKSMSTFHGIQPLRAFPQTAVSQIGHTAATCSPCKNFCGLLSFGFGCDLFPSSPWDCWNLSPFSASRYHTLFFTITRRCATEASSTFLLKQLKFKAKSHTKFHNDYDSCEMGMD
jgi:hypothetical protein